MGGGGEGLLFSSWFILYVCLFVCLHSPFSGCREVFSAIQLSETSVLCGYFLYGSAVFGVFPLYLFFLNGRAILKRLFASDQSTICNWRWGLVYSGGSSLLGSSFSLTSLWSHRRQNISLLHKWALEIFVVVVRVLGLFFFFWYSLSFLPLNFFLFFFPLKNIKMFLFVHCTKGCCKAGSLSDPWVLSFWSHARLSRWGWNWQFPWPFLGQEPCSIRAWPKGNGHPQQLILWYVWVVDQAGGQAGKDGSLTPAQSFPHWSRNQACKSATGTNEWPWMGQMYSALPLWTYLQVGRNDPQLGKHHSRLSRVSQTMK